MRRRRGQGEDRMSEGGQADLSRGPLLGVGFQMQGRRLSAVDMPVGHSTQQRNIDCRSAVIRL